MADINTISSEYVRNGYACVYKDSANSAVLIKNDAKRGFVAVGIIRKGAYNIRSSSDALYMIQKKLDEACCTNISSENTFIIIWGNEGSSHHFMGLNSVYCTASSSKMKNTLTKPFFKPEVNILSNLLKYEKVSKKTIEKRSPEYKLYTPWVVYLFIIATCIGYYFIRDDWNIFAMTTSCIENGQSYRLVTSLIMHGNLRHLIGNMVALYILGKAYTKVEGNMSFILVYLGSGIMANFIDAMYKMITGNNIAVTSAGASCAIMGVLGALIAETFVHSDFEASRTKIIVTAVAYFMLCNVGSDINVTGHFFGLLFGVFFGFLAKILTLLEDEMSLEITVKKKSDIKQKRNISRM